MMGTGGRPPLVAASPARTVPPGRVARPTDRDAELDELRQRGLAKLLNQHFTETIAKLAAEKAAADAALKDLEARKAATKDFQPSGDGEISPFDALYVSLNQWRNECRRKEKETLMLYQRYVDKFGSTGQVQVPMAPSGQTGAPSWAKIPQSPAMSAKAAAPPPNTPPVQVSAMTMEIEKHLEEYLKTGNIALPSLDFMGKQETFQSAFHRRQLEQKGADAKALEWGTSEEKAKSKVPANGLDPLVGMAGESGWNGARASDEDDEDESHRDDVLGPLFVDSHLDYDNRSIVSGLTTINSAETRRVLQECEQSVVTFLKEEKEAIRKIMTEEEVSAGSTTTHPSSAVRSVAQQAAEQAESMVRRMNEILEEFMTRDENKTVVGDVDGKKEGRPYETNNPDEKWMMYYDETYQRYYYHETNANVTRWDPPSLDALSTEKSDTESVPLSHSDVMPEAHSQDGAYTSRVALYRRKLRRERRRRFLVLALVVVAVLVGGGYKMYQRHQLRVQAMLRVKEEQAAAAAAAAAAVEAALMEQRAREEAIKREAEARAEEERKRQQRLEAERTAREEELARQAELALQEEENRRHDWVCRLPLAFAFNKRCRLLAAQNPMFDECNIALAFITHGRCRNHTPFNLHFDLQSLLLAMME